MKKTITFFLTEHTHNIFNVIIVKEFCTSSTLSEWVIIVITMTAFLDSSCSRSSNGSRSSVELEYHPVWSRRTTKYKITSVSDILQLFEIYDVTLVTVNITISNMIVYIIGAFDFLQYQIWLFTSLVLLISYNIKYDCLHQSYSDYVDSCPIPSYTYSVINNNHRNST